MPGHPSAEVWDRLDLESPSPLPPGDSPRPTVELGDRPPRFPPPDAHLRPVPHGPGGWTGHVAVARGFGRGPGQVCAGRGLQGTLLVQPHASDTEHGPAGEAPWPAGAGAQLPLPCPPPAGQRWRQRGAGSTPRHSAIRQSGLSPEDVSPELKAQGQGTASLVPAALTPRGPGQDPRPEPTRGPGPPRLGLGAGRAWGLSPFSLLPTAVPGGACSGGQGSGPAHRAGQGSSLHFLWRSSGRLRGSQCPSSTGPSCRSAQYTLRLCMPAEPQGSARPGHPRPLPSHPAPRQGHPRTPVRNSVQVLQDGASWLGGLGQLTWPF